MLSFSYNRWTFRPSRMPTFHSTLFAYLLSSIPSLLILRLASITILFIITFLRRKSRFEIINLLINILSSHITIRTIRRNMPRLFASIAYHLLSITSILYILVFLILFLSFISLIIIIHVIHVIIDVGVVTIWAFWCNMPRLSTFEAYYLFSSWAVTLIIIIVIIIAIV